MENENICNYCRNCHRTYTRTVERLDLRLFKRALANFCSTCYKGTDCPTHRLYIYLQEKYPDGCFNSKQLENLPPDLRVGICNYAHEIYYIED
ncbi:MAG: hypothetical protein IKD76_04900 [Clostridia bacterium]|nr:hypothetical protein [Clostridia bacterium]